MVNLLCADARVRGMALWGKELRGAQLANLPPVESIGSAREIFVVSVSRVHGPIQPLGPRCENCIAVLEELFCHGHSRYHYTRLGSYNQTHSNFENVILYKFQRITQVRHFCLESLLMMSLPLSVSTVLC